MSAISERIIKCIEVSGLSKTDFAKSISVSQPFISQLCSGASSPSPRTIKNICQAHGIREEWLTDGIEPMKSPKSRQDEVEIAIRSLTGGETEDFKRRFVLALASLKEEHWQLLEKKMREIVGDRPLTEAEPEKLEETIFYVPWFFQPMSAGIGEFAGHEPPEALAIKKEAPIGTSFVARVKGNSMEPTYQNGDLVFVKAQPEVEIGQIGAFYMDGQMWIKELGNGVLISHNPEYGPRTMTEDIICQGLVLGTCDSSYLL